MAITTATESSTKSVVTASRFPLATLPRKALQSPDFDCSSSSSRNILASTSTLGTRFFHSYSVCVVLQLDRTGSNTAQQSLNRSYGIFLQFHPAKSDILKESGNHINNCHFRESLYLCSKSLSKNRSGMFPCIEEFSKKYQITGITSVRKSTFYY